MLVLVILATPRLFGQWQNNAGFGQYLNTPTNGAMVGTYTVAPPAALTVYGGLSSIPNQNLFQIHSSAQGAGFARWFRNNSANLASNEQMGRIYHNGSPTNLGFNVQQCQQGGSLWLRNWRNRTSTVNGALNGTGVVDGNGLRLMDDVTFNLNGFSSNERRGYVAVGHTGTMDGQGGGSSSLPWTRLHLVHANNLTSTDPGANYVTPSAWNRNLGYRPWMRNGMMVSGNLDQMFIGHKYGYAGANPQGNEIVDASDAVLQWADTLVSPAARDNMRFIFTSSPDNVNNPTTGARSLEGLELMRLHPADSSGSIVPYVGLGDFYRLGVIGATDPLPTERLDIANGRMRHRQLPNDPEMTGADKVVVVNGNGLIGWRTYPTGGGAADCDWSVPTGATGNHVSTAYAANTADCPDQAEAVGIGVNLTNANPPLAKLQVETDDFSTGMRLVASQSSTTSTGLQLIASGGATTNQGIQVTAIANGTSTNWGLKTTLSGSTVNLRGVASETTGASYQAIAGYFSSADQSNYAYGIKAEALNGSSESKGVEGRSTGTGVGNYGLHGLTTGSGVRNFGGAGSSYSNGTSNFGLYGCSSCDNVWNTGHFAVYGEDEEDGHWAGYFQGDLMITGDGFVNNGIVITSDAQVKENVQDIPLGLASEVVAQLQPRTYTFSPAYAYLGFTDVQQAGLIAQEVEAILPHLVVPMTQPAQVDSTGAVVHPAVDLKGVNYTGIIPYLIANEQALLARLAAMEQQLALCCASDGGTLPPGAGRSPSGGAGMEMDLRTERLQIIPNPVAPSTTLRYYVPRAGRVRLELSAEDGRALENLLEMRAVEGEQQYTWDTSRLSAGVYLVALVVDEQVVVKRAVKVD